MADKEVYLGVEIPARKGFYRALGGLAGSISDREVASLAGRIAETDEIMASPGRDLTVEQAVLDDRWAALCSEAHRQAARWRLTQAEHE